MSTHLECNGAHIGYSTEYCPTSACSDVSWVWPGGATELFIYVPGVDARSGDIALPAGWYSYDQCEACHAREREMENVEYQSA